MAEKISSKKMVSGPMLSGSMVSGSVEGASLNTVLVCANLPHGQTFILKDRRVTINGNAVELKGQSKGVLPVGSYGTTLVDANDWEEVKRIYGEMPIFKSGLVFDASSEKDASSMTSEREELRHGLEPVDPEATITEPVTTKKTKRS